MGTLATKDMPKRKGSALDKAQFKEAFTTWMRQQRPEGSRGLGELAEPDDRLEYEASACGCGLAAGWLKRNPTSQQAQDAVFAVRPGLALGQRGLMVGLIKKFSDRPSLSKPINTHVIVVGKSRTLPSQLSSERGC